MKITVNRKSFAAACALATRFSGKNNVKPILLRNVKLSCNGTSELTATDLEMGVRLPVNATIDEPGDALLSTERVNAILSSVEDEEITIKATSDEVTLIGAHRLGVPASSCQ